MLSLELLFYLAIFIAAVFIFDLVMNFASSLQNSRALAANRRARMLAEGISADETLRRLTRRPSDAVGDAEGWISTRVGGLEPYIQRAGLKMTPWRFVFLVGGASVLIALGLWLGIGFLPGTAVFLGVIFASLIGFAYVHAAIRRRQARMT